MIIRFTSAETKDFQQKNFLSLGGRVGLYFIFTPVVLIPYPFKSSSLVYIGMSESRTNSIGKRLKDHFSGRSNNKGITGYSKKTEVKFTYLDLEYLKHVFPNKKIEAMEAIFLENFSEEFGTYPICNNKRGDLGDEPIRAGASLFKIDWEFFGG